MKKITSFETSDGKLFKSEHEARCHEAFLIKKQYDSKDGMFNSKLFEERRKRESGHYGNGNHKRKRAKCGMPASGAFDSIRPEDITCVMCLKELVKTSKSPWKWEKRLEEVLGDANEKM